jgi:hypothetical protein
MNENSIDHLNEIPVAPETPTPPSAAELRETLQSARDSHRVRNGKIAALPRDLLEQLNHRLERGQRGPALLDWLNAQPAVLAALQQYFEGVPISKQNLSAWRQGGYLEWQMRQELTDAAYSLYDGAREVTQGVQGSELANSLATMITAQYARLLNSWDGDPDPKFEAKLQILRRLSRDVGLLQKCLHLAARQEAEFEQQHQQAIAEFDHARWRRLLARLDAASPSDSMARLLAEDPDPVKKPDEPTAGPPLPKKPLSDPNREAQSRSVKPGQGKSGSVPPTPSPSASQS